jgi:hypothetical protein
VINLNVLSESLASTVVLTRRGFLSSNTLHKSVTKQAEKIRKSKDGVELEDAQQYLRNSIKLQTSNLLRSRGLKSIQITPENSPITYRLLSDENALSVLLEGDDGEQ